MLERTVGHVGDVDDDLVRKNSERKATQKGSRRVCFPDDIDDRCRDAKFGDERHNAPKGYFHMKRSIAGRSSYVNPPAEGKTADQVCGSSFFSSSLTVSGAVWSGSQSLTSAAPFPVPMSNPALHCT